MKTTITQNQIFRTFSRLQRSCFSAVFLLLFLLSASSSWGQIAQRGAATTVISANTTVTINKPVGIVTGDIMFANIIGYRNGTNTIVTAPTGWNTIAGTQIERAFPTLFYKIATATDANASTTSYTFTTSSSSNPSIGAIIAFSGVNTTTPFDVTAPTSWTTLSNLTINNLPSITIANAGAAILQFGAAARLTSTADTNFTNWNLSSNELYDIGSGNATIGASIVFRNTGATGVGGFTCTTNTNPRLMGGLMLALRPTCAFAITSQSTAAQSKCINSAFSSISVTTAGTGLTYQWFSNNSNSNSGGTSLGSANGAQTATFTPPSDVAGTKYYYCVVTKSCGSLTSVVSGAFTVTAEPSAGTLSGTQTLCSNGSTTLSSTVSGGTWTSASTSIATVNSSGIVNGVVAGTSLITYTVAGTGGCSDATANLTVTVSSTPSTITISPASATICNGQIQSLVASGGNIIQSTSLSSGSINLPILDNSATGVSNTLAISGIPSNASITKIDVTFSLTHAWLSDTEITLTAPNGKIIALAADQGPSGPGTYSNAVITSDNTALALSTTSTPITGTFKANATAAGTLIGSFGSNLTQTFSDLFSTQNGNWKISAFDDANGDLGTLDSWSIVITYGTPQTTWSPTTSLYTDAAATTAYTGSVASTVYAMPTANTTYTATAASGDCTTTASTILTVNQPVSISTNPSTGTQAKCINGSAFTALTVAATGTGLTYLWKQSSNQTTWATAVGTGGTTTSFVPSNTTAGTLYYKCTVSGTSPCSPLDSGISGAITVNALPTVTATANQSVCSGNSVTLSGNGASTYVWNNSITNGVAFTPSATTTYTVTGTDANGCSNNSTSTVTVNQPVSISTNPSTGTQAKCINGSAFTALTVAATGTGLTYLWKQSSNQTTWATAVGTGGTTTSFVPSNTTAGTLYYKCTVSGTSPCSPLDSGISGAITVNALPTVTATANQSVCSGNSVTLSGSGASTYVWNNSITNGVAFTPSATTTYTVTGTDANGCTNTATSTVTVNTIPTTTNTTICAGGSGSLSVTSACADLTGQTSGPRDATTGANVTGVGAVAWANTGNIAAASTAGMAVAASSATNYLQGTGYGFSIPSNATINGITVTINRSTSGTTSPLLRDNQVSLVKGGTIQTTNKAVSGTNWPGTLTSATYGGTTDLWSSAWTAADINASNFGVVLSAINNNTGSSRTAAVDFMQITVTYTLPGELNWYTQSSGGSVIGTGSSFNPVGVTDSGLANTNTSGTTSYYVACSTAAGACRAKADFVILSTPNAPTATNGMATITCTTPGAVTISADAGSGNSVKWYNVSSGGTSLSTGNSYAPSISSTTNYYAESVSSNGCASLTRTPVEAKVIKTNSWVGGASGSPTDWFTAANWSCGVPTDETAVVIPDTKTVSIYYNTNAGPAYAYSVTLQGNANVTVTSGHGINVTNKLNVPSTASFIIEDNASLVQKDAVTNEGVITVKKSTPVERKLKIYDAVLWSSPVASKLKAVSPGTTDNYFLQYVTSNDSWATVATPASHDAIGGKGYLIRTPTITGGTQVFDYTTPQQWNVNFVGIPNNGDITISAGNTGNTEKYLLVGNPYPSAISIAAFKAGNPNITGVFYFYRKPNGVTGISSYGTLAANGQFSTNDADNLVGAIAPGDVIASGQGFFVAMKSDNNNGEVYFTNTMREANDHGHFNRINTNLDSYKLIVQTPLGGNSQFITNYNAETTSGYDVGYDAVAFTDGTTDLSAIMNNENYRIQSKGDYNVADIIQVQFKTGVAGQHRIKLQDAQGVFAADQMVIIKDNLTGVQHNLTANGDYVFTSATGTFTNRFEVIYQQAYYTALQANSCGATIANMSSLVYADIVNGATGYRFKVVNNTTAAVQTIDRPQHWFAFNMLSAYDYNTPYTISVQVQKDGVWTGYYGATCTVNSPNIAATGVMQINPSQCGMTLPTIGTVIATTPVAGATGYKFRITNTTANAMGNNLVQEVTRTNHWFTLAMLTRYNYGSSYAIEVAVKTTAGYTPYGNACTVYAPAVPTLASCGQTVATATTLVRTTATTLATQYRFQVTRMATQETITFDTANYWFSFRVNVPGYAAGEQYGVRVAVMTAGAWSPYGDACDITAPIATARTTEEAAPSEANLFKPVAYPNPFASTFGISLATPSADVIHVMVYDLQGRLIEKQNVFVSQLDSLQIGTNYPSGDYLLVVAQGANIKSSHIHKD